MPAEQLPTPVTSFVGRNEEMTRITALLADPNCRLLTLVGPGGIGKTRLALQSATERQADFVQGVCFVPLAAVNSPDLIVSASAAALQLSFYGSEDPAVQIVNYLREKQILLIMDNFEHLLNGTSLLTDILQAAPGVKFLVTSRERLNVQEEWVLALDGLRFPNDQAAELLESYSAVELFVQRARQVQANFSLADNIQAVKTLCQQVEGMPLGLELAATWLRAMSCRQIAVQLASNLDFLTTPIRNIPERHRSLRTVFEQSWNMLSETTQNVLMHLSVFRGGFDLEAAEDVAGASIPDLASLADKSLIRLSADGRYDLHELLRQFVAEKLTLGEASAIAHKHQDYFLRLAEQAETYQYGSKQSAWFDRLEAELGNIRAALSWSLDLGSAEAGLHIVAAMRAFWEYRSHMQEGLSWSERLLAVTEDVSPSLRAKALYSTGELAGQLYLFERTVTLCTEALDLARQIGDPWLIAWALSAFGFWTERVRATSATTVPMLDESLVLFRKIDDAYGLSHALRRRAIVAAAQGDYPYANTLVAEALMRAREAGDKQATAWSLQILGDILLRDRHDLSQTMPLFEESLLLFGELDNSRGILWSMTLLGRIEQLEGHNFRAQALYGEALTLMLETGGHMRNMYRYCLAGLGTLLEIKGKLKTAACLLLAAKWSDWFDLPLYPAAEYDSQLTTLRARLGENAWTEVSAEVRAMRWEQAAAYALQQVRLTNETEQLTLVTRATQFERLSAREVEILRLIAADASNQEIAQQLVIGMSTVKKHINHIFSKLGVGSRTQAVGRARSLNLL